MRRILIAASLAAATLGVATSALAWPERGWHSALDEKGQPVPSSWSATSRFSGATLASSDSLRVREGSQWQIRASGDPAVLAELRYMIDGGSLIVGRRWRERAVEGSATIEVTAPSVKALTLAGSGTLEADRLRGDTVAATVAGSGNLALGDLQAREFSGTMAGSGKLQVAGRSEQAHITIAGSGDIDARALSVDTAGVSIAGSGDAALRATRTVKANIVGSGDVTVTGGAKCTQTRMGSGRLRCSG
jgi:hypothetical protein